MGRLRVVGVRFSDNLGDGRVGVPEIFRKGLEGVLMLRPPHLGQRYLSTVVCWPEGFNGKDPGFPRRRGW